MVRIIKLILILFLLTDIKNLNDIKHNFPVFYIIAKKDDEIYVFSAKARKRYGANGKINPCYNILSGRKTIPRKYKKALVSFIKNPAPIPVGPNPGILKPNTLDISLLNKS